MRRLGLGREEVANGKPSDPPRRGAAGSGGAGAPAPSTREELGEEAAAAPPRRLLGIPGEEGSAGSPGDWLAARLPPPPVPGAAGGPA